MRTTIGVLVLVHGIAFWTSSITLTGLLGDDGATSEVLLFDSPPGSLLMWLLAVVWMGIGAGLVTAGVGVLQGRDWAARALALSLPPALVITVLWARQAPVGLVVTAVVLAALAVPAVRREVLPR